MYDNYGMYFLRLQYSMYSIIFHIMYNLIINLKIIKINWSKITLN
jgi:hypothetical protein